MPEKPTDEELIAHCLTLDEKENDFARRYSMPVKKWPWYGLAYDLALRLEQRNKDVAELEKEAGYLRALVENG